MLEQRARKKTLISLDFEKRMKIIKFFSNFKSLRCKPIRHSASFNNEWNRDKNLNEFVSSNSVYVDHSKNVSTKEKT